jgi:hypothetical protein
MAEILHECDVYISEQSYPNKDISYTLKVWARGLVLDIPMAEHQILEVLEEVPHNSFVSAEFRRRDYIATCLLTAEQFEEMTDYEDEDEE